ncbi:hypothetical protein D9613_012447 [Agrocybe pediades]|uniref:Uncharacterized protein n=1 Tax=Agrocybe pediades TaxID=84607 RepID=A0A8H4QR17_9AGAR|nr:hypothetical protein D9613_012447 [Agrocybe pediades]
MDESSNSRHSTSSSSLTSGSDENSSRNLNSDDSDTSDSTPTTDFGSYYSASHSSLSSTDSTISSRLQDSSENDVSDSDSSDTEDSIPGSLAQSDSEHLPTTSAHNPQHNSSAAAAIPDDEYFEDMADLSTDIDKSGLLSSSDEELEGRQRTHHRKTAASSRLTRSIRRRIEAMYSSRYEKPRTRFPRGPSQLQHVLDVLKNERPDLRLTTSALAGDPDPYSRVIGCSKPILGSVRVCSHGSPGAASQVLASTASTRG